MFKKSVQIVNFYVFSLEYYKCIVLYAKNVIFIMHNSNFNLKSIKRLDGFQTQISLCCPNMSDSNEWVSWKQQSEHFKWSKTGSGGQKTVHVISAAENLLEDNQLDVLKYITSTSTLKQSDLLAGRLVFTRACSKLVKKLQSLSWDVRRLFSSY